MTPARWMTLLGYLAAVFAVGLAVIAYAGFGGGPGAAILALGVLKFGTTAALLVAVLAAGFAIAEIRETPVRTFPAVATAGAAGLILVLLSLMTVRLWFY